WSQPRSRRFGGALCATRAESSREPRDRAGLGATPRAAAWREDCRRRFAPRRLVYPGLAPQQIALPRLPGSKIWREWTRRSLKRRVSHTIAEVEFGLPRMVLSVILQRRGSHHGFS